MVSHAKVATHFGGLHRHFTATTQQANATIQQRQQKPERQARTLSQPQKLNPFPSQMSGCFHHYCWYHWHRCTTTSHTHHWMQNLFVSFNHPGLSSSCDSPVRVGFHTKLFPYLVCAPWTACTPPAQTFHNSAALSSDATTACNPPTRGVCMVWITLEKTLEICQCSATMFSVATFHTKHPLIHESSCSLHYSID